jgi:hypothetical protein
MRTTDEAGNPYDILPYPSPDFVRLQAAVADRAPTLRLHLTRVDGSGPPIIEVLVPPDGSRTAWTIGSYIARSHLPTNARPTGCWQIHHPERGPQMEFNTAQQVAKFLSVAPSFSEGWEDAWNQWMLARGELFASE